MGETMKTLLLFLFLSTNSQTIIYNTPYEEFYVIDVSTNPIQILVIEENINLEISCIQNEMYNLKDIEFTNNSACLMDTLNQKFDLNIQDMDELDEIIERLSINYDACLEDFENRVEVI
jgi:hypothetical protein